MALSDNPFITLTLAQVQALQVEYLQILKDIAGGGQSYTQGRQFTRADLRAVTATLSQIGNAIQFLGGTGLTAVVPISSQLTGKYGGQWDNNEFGC